MKTKQFGLALALVASAMLAVAPASAGNKGGKGGGYGGGGGTNYYGGGGGKGYGGNGYGGNGYGGNAEAFAGITQIFKGGGGHGSNYLFGAASVIGALNPPEGQKIIVRGGDVKVQINFIGAGASEPAPIK